MDEPALTIDVRWSDERDKIAPALVAALGEMPTVPKGEKADIPMKSGGKFSYSYADLAGYLAAVRPILAKHGLGVLQPATNNNGTPQVTTIVLHISGQYLSSTLTLRTNGTDAQAVGSAITYARRYALGAILGIATDDDDGAAASKRPTPEPKRRNDPPSPRDEEPAGPTKAQMAKMMAILGELGIKERGDRLALTAHIVGHELTSASDLTRAEATKVVDRLMAVEDKRAAIRYGDDGAITITDTEED